MTANWTVMVLMGANNLPNEADLTGYAIDDLLEMKAVGSGPHLNIVVQIDQKPEAGGPLRFRVAKSDITDQAVLQKGQGSSGDPNVLESFLHWAKKEYPAERYLLVIWGHAWRFAFERDGKDALDFTKLANVLQNTNAGKKLDVVAFDSCGVSWIEAAYQLRDSANYLVATQFTDPLPGWPYDEILQRLLDDPEMGPEDLGRAIVSQFVRHYDKSAKRYHDRAVANNSDEPATVTMTTLDLSYVKGIGDGMGTLANKLALAVHEDQDELDRVNEAFRRSRVPIKEPAVDLTTLCWNLATFTENDTVRSAACAVGDLLLRPTNPFIVAHASSDLSVAMLHGASIFAPNVAPEFDSRSLRPLYEALELSQDTLWDELVFALAEPDL